MENKGNGACYMESSSLTGVSIQTEIKSPQPCSLYSTKQVFASSVELNSIFSSAPWFIDCASVTSFLPSFIRIRGSSFKFAPMSDKRYSSLWHDGSPS